MDKDQQSHAAAQLLFSFGEAWAQRMGEPHRDFNKREKTQAEALVAAWPFQRLRAAVAAFFAEPSPYYEQQGWPFGLFSNDFQKLSASAGRDEAAQQRDESAATKTERYLGDMKARQKTPMPDWLKEQWRDRAQGKPLREPGDEQERPDEPLEIDGLRDEDIPF